MTVRPDPTPTRPARVWTGIGIAIGGHLLTILAGWLAAAIYSSPGGGGESAVLNFVFIAAVGQAILALAALITGVILIVSGRHRGLGAGLITGWAAGLLLSAATGYGVAVLLYHTSGSGSIG